MLWVVVAADECLRYICAGAPTRVALQLLENAYFNWDFPMGLRVSQVPAFFLEFANQWNCLSNGVFQNNGLKIWNDLNNEQRIGNFRQCMACASRASVAQSSSEKLSVLSSSELQQPTHIFPFSTLPHTTSTWYNLLFTMRLVFCIVLLCSVALVSSSPQVPFFSSKSRHQCYMKDIRLM